MIRKAVRYKQLPPHKHVVVTRAPNQVAPTRKKSSQEVAQAGGTDKATPAKRPIPLVARLEEIYTCVDPDLEPSVTTAAIEEHKRLRSVAADLHQRHVEALERRHQAFRRYHEMSAQAGPPRGEWPDDNDFCDPDNPYHSPLGTLCSNAWVRLRNFERQRPEVLSAVLRDEVLTREERKTMKERLRKIREWQRLAALWREMKPRRRQFAVFTIYPSSTQVATTKKHKSPEKDTSIRVIYLDEKHLLSWWPSTGAFKLMDAEGPISDLLYLNSSWKRVHPNMLVVGHSMLVRCEPR